MTGATPTYPTCEIPSVDLGPFFEEKGVVIGKDPTDEQREVASTINQVCRKHGFVHVTNFGMSSEMGERLFAATGELFDPTKTQDYAAWSPATNTGYSAYRNESLNRNRPPDLKEAFNIRFPPAWDNPSLPKTPASFQSIVDDYVLIMKKASMRYALVCALALDLPLDTFTKMLNTYDICTAKFLHYPPCEFGEGSASACIKEPIRVGEHTDFGAYTFLLLGDEQGPMGLQIKSGERGGECGGSAGGEECGWMNVEVAGRGGGDGREPNTSGTFGAIINTGAMMARMTNDYWKATPHRVIVPTEEYASKDRYSIALFVDPDGDELIQIEGKYKDYQHASSDETNEHVAGPVYHEPISSRNFVLMQLKEMAEAANQEQR